MDPATSYEIFYPFFDCSISGTLGNRCGDDMVEQADGRALVLVLLDCRPYDDSQRCHIWGTVLLCPFRRMLGLCCENRHCRNGCDMAGQ